ncbi:PetM family of cytochrome b6f complex subunit 7 [uncultured Methylobacterium sp.]|uniref:PetM family of cytochrome b6f complex subunit 7 n=1 Tax=uncultured Methylobacterium sp. TaxID=157278 RepID=UPI0035CB55F0
MFRFLSRLLGFLLLAAGFVALVYDGARSVANNGLRITPLSELLFTLFKDRASALQGTVEGAAPWLWSALVLPLTLAPAALLGLGLGAALLWLGQPAREPIGFLTRS